MPTIPSSSFKAGIAMSSFIEGISEPFSAGPLLVPSMLRLLPKGKDLCLRRRADPFRFHKWKYTLRISVWLRNRPSIVHLAASMLLVPLAGYRRSER